jgi:hypothetical protein
MISDMLNAPIAQAARTGVQNLAGEDRHQRGRSAQQHHDKIQGKRAEQHGHADDIFEARQDHLHGDGAMFHAAGPDMKAEDEREKQQQRHQRERIDDARAFQVRAVNPMVKRQGKEQAAESRAAHVGELKDRAAPCDGVDEMLLGHKMGNERRAGRRRECASRAHNEEHRVDRQHAAHPIARKHQERDCADDLHRVADEYDATAVEAVGDVPGGQEKKQSRQKECEAGVTKIECAMRDGVNLPGDGDGLRFGPEDHGGARQLIPPEVSIGERFQASSMRLVGWGVHLYLRVSRSGGSWCEGAPA